MAGLSKVEEYLIDLGISYEEIAPSTWLVEDDKKGLPKTVVSLADPIVMIRAEVMDAPKAGREAFFQELLKLNAEALIHGAYALDGERVVLIDTHELAGFDKSELEASLEAVGFELAERYPRLKTFR